MNVGQILNIHKICQDVGIQDSVGSKWLYYMERSGIIFYLTPYENNLLKRTIKSKKIFFFDTGLVAYLTKCSSPEILENHIFSSSLLENYVVLEVRKNYNNRGKTAPLYYYHDKDGKEIDLIIEQDGMLYPIEI